MLAGESGKGYKIRKVPSFLLGPYSSMFAICSFVNPTKFILSQLHSAQQIMTKLIKTYIRKYNITQISLQEQDYLHQVDLQAEIALIRYHFPFFTVECDCECYHICTFVIITILHIELNLLVKYFLIPEFFRLKPIYY